MRKVHRVPFWHDEKEAEEVEYEKREGYVKGGQVGDHAYFQAGGRKGEEDATCEDGNEDEEEGEQGENCDSVVVGAKSGERAGDG